jgi:hypothetical protein
MALTTGKTHSLLTTPGDADASNASLSRSSITMPNEGFGGGNATSGHGKGTANDNTVTIENSTVYSVFGGHGYGKTESIANNNSVTLKNVTAATDQNSITAGGLSSGMVSAGSWTPIMSASGNSVTLIDSHVGGVFGGSISSSSTEASLTAKDNTVTLEGNVTIDSFLAGGYIPIARQGCQNCVISGNP